MPKKSFKDNPALAFIGNQQEPLSKQRTHETQKENTPVKENPLQSPALSTAVHPPTPVSDGEPTYYRINLKLRVEYKTYLEQVSWENRKSITQYINELIQADMDTRDTKDTKDTKDIRDTQDTRDIRDTRDTQDIQDTQHI